MKSSTQDQAQGTFHKIAGKIKELFGNASLDTELEGEGKDETRAGKVQQKVGEVEKAVGQ
ncbi:MAG: CsbD family protein [Deltaproteobacteria bacterium]|nr:CsbD family protein [Deltaproteobacteria bacterium]